MQPPPNYDASAQNAFNLDQSNEKKESEQNARQEQVDAILRMWISPDARERIKRIAVVKPEKAKEVEQSLIRAIQAKQMIPPVSDEQLLRFLTRENSTKENRINFVRKSTFDDY